MVKLLIKIVALVAFLPPRSADASVAIRQCNASETCEEPFEMTCTEALEAYSFNGDCCSLADSPEGGCVLTVSGAATQDGQAADCTFNQKECPECCTTYEDGTVGCVAPGMCPIFVDRDVSSICSRQRRPEYTTDSPPPFPLFQNHHPY